MSSLPYPPLLAEMLRAVARRYRVPALPAACAPAQAPNPATALAIAIEQARTAVARAQTPDTAVKHRFIESLAHLIRQALDADGADPAFQAMVLRHSTPRVREYASLAAHAERDRRQVRAMVNAMAHPAKQMRAGAGPEREALAALHASASSESWPELADTARRLIAEGSSASALEPGLRKLLDDPALEHLLRLDALASDEGVRQYRSLWDRQGPRSGSPAAAAQGGAARRRGAAVEAQAAQALEALARRLNEAEAACAPYRVVTSMHVPGSMPGNAERAKTEWDAALLRQAHAVNAAPAWDVCLLVEVKASPDAATTDFPRLLRGLRLLAQAQEDLVYPFATQQGTVRLRGASLRALPTDEHALADTVLYCSDAPADTPARALSAASRMQLLSAPASLSFASSLAQNRPADPGELEPVWQQLLESPRWQPVLRQYATLRRVRELMVHIADLSAAIDATDTEA